LIPAFFKRKDVAGGLGEDLGNNISNRTCENQGVNIRKRT